MFVVHAVWAAANRLALWGDGLEPAEAVVDLLAASAVDGLARKATVGELDLLLPARTRLHRKRVPVALFEVDAALDVLDVLRGKLCLEVRGHDGDVTLAPLGDSVRFIAELAAIAADFVARRRVLPALVEEADGLAARWMPVPAAGDRDLLRTLAQAAPPVLRAENRDRAERIGYSSSASTIDWLLTSSVSLGSAGPSSDRSAPS